jgi:Glycosyltransferase family 87
LPEITRFPALRRADWPALLTMVVAGIIGLRNLFAVAQFVLHRSLEGDFALYYVFARIGLRHGWGSLYDLSAQRQEWHAFGPTLFYPEIYTPPLAWLVAPFALLPFQFAIALWTVGLVAALVLTWWLCAPRTRWPERLAHLAIAFALAPVAFGLLLGQVVVVVAAAVAGAWWLIRRQRPFTAGLVLALIALKPQLAFLVPLALLASGRRRAFAGWVTGSGAILAVCLLTLGIDGLWAYGSRLVAASNSLDAFVVPVQLTLAGFLGGGLMAHTAQLGVIAITLVFCWRRRANGPEFPIAAGLCASLLVTPFVHSQDLAMLLPAAWLSLRTAWSPFERTLGVSGYVASLLLATPLPLLLVLVGWAPLKERMGGRVPAASSPGLG